MLMFSALIYVLFARCLGDKQENNFDPIEKKFKKVEKTEKKHQRNRFEKKFRLSTPRFVMCSGGTVHTTNIHFGHDKMNENGLE